MRMKRVLTFSAILFIATTMALLAGARGQQAPPAAPAVPGLTLTSTAFDDGSIIPPKYTQADPNPVSPKLQWTNVPPNVVSFTLILHDADVAVEKKTEDILHWMAFNIPGTARELPEGVPSANAQLADGTIQAKNRRGTVGYMGPGMGPQGPYHHYTFDLYALDTKLSLGPDASRADVLVAMNGHIVAKAVLVGRFHR